MPVLLWIIYLRKQRFWLKDKMINNMLVKFVFNYAITLMPTLIVYTVSKNCTLGGYILIIHVSQRATAGFLEIINRNVTLWVTLQQNAIKHNET